MIEFVKVSKSFDNSKVLDKFSISIEEGEVLCLLGPSGCGKSTILKIIAGLDKNYEGKIHGLENLTLSYVFQESRLIPWLTVKENLLYVLEGHVDKLEIDNYIDLYLEKVELLSFKNSYPNTLSGGMKQRVSLARAFSMPYDILLLDEPFQGLDDKLKNQLMAILESLINQNKKTVIMVTHNLKEAFRLGDKILKLEGMPIKYSEEIKIENNK